MTAIVCVSVIGVTLIALAIIASRFNWEKLPVKRSAEADARLAALESRLSEYVNTSALDLGEIRGQIVRGKQDLDVCKADLRLAVEKLEAERSRVVHRDVGSVGGPFRRA